MQKHLFRLGVLVLLACSVMVAPALAHEGREVGDYTLTFGWQVEPAYAGVYNGPEVFISLHGHHEEESDDHEHEEGAEHEETGFPADIEVKLQAEVTFGDQSLTLPLRPAYGETGHYVANLIPTAPGDYTFRITGTIGDTAVDETFSSADGEFSSIELVTDILFPYELSVDARIAALEARIAELEAQLSE